MLEVKVLSFSDLILKDNFSIVNFFSFDEGFIGIHVDHEKMKFKLFPSKIIFKKENKEVVLYSGFGFVSVFNNSVFILGYPISENRETFDLKCNQLNDYGKNVFNSFVNQNKNI